MSFDTAVSQFVVAQGPLALTLSGVTFFDSCKTLYISLGAQNALLQKLSGTAFSIETLQGVH